MCCINLAIVLFNNNSSGAITILLFSTISCSFLLVLSIYVINHIGYKIDYDKNNNMLYRHGFLFGYKSYINIEDIREIVVRFIPKLGEFYDIIDSHHTSIGSSSKNAFFRIQKNNKNLLFIRQFWDGIVE